MAHHLTLGSFPSVTFRLIILFVFFAVAAKAVEIGATRAAVCKELGDPVNVVEGANRAILTFSNHQVVTFVEDRVTDISQEASPHSRLSAGDVSLDDGRKILISGCVAIASAGVLSIFFFGTWLNFWECVRFYFQPDVISLFRGDIDRDRWDTMKLWVWIACSVGCGVFCFTYLGGSADAAWSFWLSVKKKYT